MTQTSIRLFQRQSLFPISRKRRSKYWVRHSQLLSWLIGHWEPRSNQLNLRKKSISCSYPKRISQKYSNCQIPYLRSRKKTPRSKKVLRIPMNREPCRYTSLHLRFPKWCQFKKEERSAWRSRSYLTSQILLTEQMPSKKKRNRSLHRQSRWFLGNKKKDRRCVFPWDRVQPFFSNYACLKIHPSHDSDFSITLNFQIGWLRWTPFKKSHRNRVKCTSC